MKAKVTKSFPGVPDGESITRTIEVDEIITGDLAEVAVREEWAEEVVDKPARKARKSKKKADDTNNDGDNGAGTEDGSSSDGGDSGDDDSPTEDVD